MYMYIHIEWTTERTKKGAGVEKGHAEAKAWSGDSDRRTRRQSYVSERQAIEDSYLCYINCYSNSLRLF